MSYINDALHKAQKENKSSWAEGHSIASAEEKKPDTWRKWYTIIGLSAVFLFAAGMMGLLHWSDLQSGRRNAPVIRAPLAATVTPAAAQIAEVPAPVQKENAPGPASSPYAAAPVAAEAEAPQAQSAVSPLEVKAGKPAGAAQPAVELKAKPEEPADPKKLYAQALQKQREGKLAEAEALYRQVLEKEPRSIQALNNLGVVHLKVKRYRRAAIRFHEALSIKNDYVDAHYNLACLYARKSDAQKSLFYLENAINLNPQVKSWAADDADFEGLAKLPDFQKLMQARDN
jgi:tetratricopeptide (TPR) repeat protein